VCFNGLHVVRNAKRFASASIKAPNRSEDFDTPPNCNPATVFQMEHDWEALFHGTDGPDTSQTTTLCDDVDPSAAGNNPANSENIDSSLNSNNNYDNYNINHNSSQDSMKQESSGLLQGDNYNAESMPGMNQLYEAMGVCDNASLQYPMNQGSSGLLQGSSGLLQGSSGLLQGSSGLLQGSFGLLQGDNYNAQSMAGINQLNGATGVGDNTSLPIQEPTITYTAPTFNLFVVDNSVNFSVNNSVDNSMHNSFDNSVNNSGGNKENEPPLTKGGKTKRKARAKHLNNEIAESRRVRNCKNAHDNREKKTNIMKDQLEKITNLEEERRTDKKELDSKDVTIDILLSTKEKDRIVIEQLRNDVRKLSAVATSGP